MTQTFASLFTGFGGADIGAQAAGYTLAWGLEHRADIAAVANANLGNHVRIADILASDPNTFARVDLLHASPPCPNFSVAKAGRGETAHDLALARRVAEFVTVLKPRAFTLENVIAYQSSNSWRVIEDALWQADYWVRVERVNAADFGVPQTRRRMIARAVRDGMVPGLPAPVPWSGWYAAIADLIDDLPDSQFAPWQLKRLPELIDGVFFTVAQQSNPRVPTELGYGCPTRGEAEPAFTITTQAPSWFKAFLMSNAKTEYSDGVRLDNEPALAVTAQRNGRLRGYLLTGQYGQPNDVAERTAQRAMDDAPSFTVTAANKGDWRAWLADGRVVAMTPRCLARLQSFPDWYELPAKNSLAALGIGNAVPPLLYQRIAETLCGS